MFKYAMLNSDRVCTGITFRGEQVNKDNLILLSGDEGNVVNKRYENGAWEGLKLDNVLEEAIYSTSLNVEYLVLLKEMEVV